MSSVSDFEVLGNLGEGSFGRVVLVSPRANPDRLYAMKVMRKRRLSQRTVQHTISEVKTLQALSTRPHPFIVQLAFSFHDTENLYLVTEYVGGTPLP